MRMNSWTTRIVVATLIALVAAGCGGDDSSGLATLQGVTTTAPSESLTAAGADEPASGAGAARDSDEAAASTAAGVAAVDETGPDSTAPEDQVVEPTSENELDELTDEERLLEFAQCMRDNGVDFPDPIVEADGTIGFGLRPGRGGGAQNGEALQSIGRDPDLPAARAACSEIIEGLALGPGGQNFDELRVELMDRLLEFAQCMRDQGVDIPDPDPNVFAPGGGGGRPFGGLDLDDADVATAFEVCQDRLPVRPGSGGGQ